MSFGNNKVVHLKNELSLLKINNSQIININNNLKNEIELKNQKIQLIQNEN